MPKIPDYFTRIVKKAKNAWEDRKTREGETHVSYRVLSVYFEKSLHIPRNPNQLGDMFFETPSDVDLLESLRNA